MLENTASAACTFRVDDADMDPAHARSTFSAAGASLTVLFCVLIGLGMSVGRGILALCGVGTLFLCILLSLLDRRRAADVRVPVRSDAHAIAASH